MNCVNKCEFGLLYKTHKSSKSKYVFRCDCFHGQKYKYPEWKGVNAVEFENVNLEMPKPKEVQINKEW